MPKTTPNSNPSDKLGDKLTNEQESAVKRNYWSKREAEEKILRAEMGVLEYEKELAKAYKQAMKDIQDEVNAFYAKYSKDNEITLDEARKRLTPQEAKEFQSQAKHYIEEVQRLGKDAFSPDYEKYLETLSKRAYISKMAAFETNIRHKLEMLNAGYGQDLTQMMMGTYEDSYYKTLYDTQKHVGIDADFTRPSEYQLEVAIKQAWVSDNYAKRVQTNKADTMRGVHRILVQEFVRGKGVRDVTAQIEEQLGVSYRRARMLARTEINYIANQGTQAAYEESGVVEKYQILATLDNYTSEICSELDGQIFDLKDAEAGVTQPPFHPHCRTTTIPYYEDNIIEQRVARDDGTGHNYLLPEDISYKDWYQKHVVEKREKEAKSRAKLIKGVKAADKPMTIVEGTKDKGFSIPKPPDNQVIKSKPYVPNRALQAVKNPDAIGDLTEPVLIDVKTMYTRGEINKKKGSK